MPRSLANGDYSLVMAIESASRANSWYRVLADRRSGNLSCDCPAWTFNQAGSAAGTTRSCKHTRIAHLLTSGQVETQQSELLSGSAAEEHPLVSATRRQWPGLGGRWSLEMRSSLIDRRPYQFVLLRLATGNGGTASGVVA